MPRDFERNYYGTLALLALDLLRYRVTYHNELLRNGGSEMSEENSTGNNLIWAVTLIIVVALIAGALYYSGFLGGTRKQTQKIDVEVSTPAR